MVTFPCIQLHLGVAFADEMSEGTGQGMSHPSTQFNPLLVGEPLLGGHPIHLTSVLVGWGFRGWHSLHLVPNCGMGKEAEAVLGKDVCAEVQAWKQRQSKSAMTSGVMGARYFPILCISKAEITTSPDPGVAY